MKILSHAAIGAIRLYQWILVPILPASCRYWPSCSTYALEAIARHGAWRGAWLGVGRILRCNPWAGFGLDPVPERFSLRAVFLPSRDSAAEPQDNRCAHAHRGPI